MPRFSSAALATAMIATAALALPVGAGAAGCPNEAIRVEQHSTALPDCRAYEQVSPVEKNGGEVVGDGVNVVPAADGNGVVFSARTGFGETKGSGQAGQVQYLAQRGPGGWTSKGVTPTSAPESLQIFLGSTSIPFFSEDLSSAVLDAYDLPGASDDVSQGTNIYRENTATGALQTISVTHEEEIGPFSFSAGELWGVAADDSHVAFVNGTKLLPEAVSGQNAYDWSNGELRLAGILPDGSVPPEGSDIRPRNYRGTVSADGSRIVFVARDETAEAGGEPQLFMRIDGSRTVRITESESTVPVPEPTNVNLQGVTPDGHHVLFTTSSKLLDADTNEGSDLYMYTDSPNPATDSNLTLISNSGQVDNTSDGSSVVGFSDDASRVYFQEDPTNSLFLWDHGTLSLVMSGVKRMSSGSSGQSLSLPDSDPGFARVSSDGNRVAFLSDSSLGNDLVHGLTGEVVNNHIEMYVFDATSKTLRCVSCVQHGGVSVGASVQPAATQGTAGSNLADLRPRFLSTDGLFVFFSTASALVPQDVNGVTDVYEYNTETGALSLLSSGHGSVGTWFSGASASGNDVFLVTREQLVGSDRDDGVDMYDARVAGGFPEPPAPAPVCVVEACRPLVAPSGGSLAASAGVSGAGNVLPAVVSVPPTRAQKLARAIRQCARRPKRRRKRCVAAAHRLYGAKAARTTSSLGRTK